MTWKEIIQYILLEAREVHKIYSIKDGFCALTDIRGNRYVIDEDMDFEEVVQIINQIKTISDHGKKNTSAPASCLLR